jgi:hypothetical protein
MLPRLTARRAIAPPRELTARAVDAPLILPRRQSHHGRSVPAGNATEPAPGPTDPKADQSGHSLGPLGAAVGPRPRRFTRVNTT